MKNSIHKLQSLIAVGWLLPVLSASCSSALAAASGEDTFKAKCAMCHGQDGSGNTPMGKRTKLRDLRSAEVQKETDDDLASTIKNGKSPMPAYGKTLSAKEIQDLVAYIRSIAKKS